MITRPLRFKGDVIFTKTLKKTISIVSRVKLFGSVPQYFLRLDARVAFAFQEKDFNIIFLGVTILLKSVFSIIFPSLKTSN